MDDLEPATLSADGVTSETIDADIAEATVASTDEDVPLTYTAGAARKFAATVVRDASAVPLWGLKSVMLCAALPKAANDKAAENKIPRTLNQLPRAASAILNSCWAN